MLLQRVTGEQHQLIGDQSVEGLEDNDVLGIPLAGGIQIRFYFEDVNVRPSSGSGISQEATHEGFGTLPTNVGQHSHSSNYVSSLKHKHH